MSSDSKNLMQTIDGIKTAEKEAARIREQTEQKIEANMKKAKAEALRISRQVEQEIVALKDARTREGRKEIETEVKKLLAKAEKQGIQIRTKKLDKKELEKLSNFVLQTE